jgi:predicted ATP-grasp superfamily ATP-dependent carboligase
MQDMATRQRPSKPKIDVDALLKQADELEKRAAESSKKVQEHLDKADEARAGLKAFVRKYG